LKEPFGECFCENKPQYCLWEVDRHTSLLRYQRMPSILLSSYRSWDLVKAPCCVVEAVPINKSRFGELMRRSCATSGGRYFWPRINQQFGTNLSLILAYSCLLLIFSAFEGVAVQDISYLGVSLCTVLGSSPCRLREGLQSTSLRAASGVPTNTLCRLQCHQSMAHIGPSVHERGCTLDTE
jgi:hypothetical protein